MKTLPHAVNAVCHGYRLMKQDDYFWSIFNPFNPGIVFRGSWGSSVNWLEPKTEPPLPNLACPNL